MQLMEKRNVFYLIVFLLLLSSLIASLIYISLLKNTLSRVNMHYAIQEDILQAELSELYETQLQENGFYISPAIVGEASTGAVGGVLHFYNSFTTPKTFSFELIPGSTPDFPYDSLELLMLSPEVIGPDEWSNILFVLQITDDTSFPEQRSTTGQYTVQILADGEIIGEDTLDVIILIS